MNKEEKPCNLDLSFEFEDRKQNNSFRENDKCLYSLEEKRDDDEKVKLDISFEFPETEKLFAEKETLPYSKGKRNR